MQNKFIKNIDFGAALEFATLVDYRPGQVVSRTFVQNESMSLTLFAFAAGQGLSTHSAPGDALVYILDGQAEVTIGGQKQTVVSGQSIVMPANIPHGLEAREPFKMLLIVVFK